MKGGSVKNGHLLKGCIDNRWRTVLFQTAYNKETFVSLTYERFTEFEVEENGHSKMVHFLGFEERAEQIYPGQTIIQRRGGGGLII